MAQLDIPGNSHVKAKGKHVAEENDRSLTQRAADSWLIELKRRLTEFEFPHQSENVSIYRVPNFSLPKSVVGSKREAYEPVVVSLGPYHYNKDSKFSGIDCHKLDAVHRTLRRIKRIPDTVRINLSCCRLVCVTVEGLVAEVKKLESRVRACYADTIELDGETLGWILTVDACFILEFIRCCAEKQTTFSVVFHSSHSSIMFDMLKIENQIPICVLIKILQFESITYEKSTWELSKMLSESRMFEGYPFSLGLSGDELIAKLNGHILGGACHLLDLYRKLISDFLNPDPDSEWTDEIEPIVTAELLDVAGINFKPGKVGFDRKWIRRSTFLLPQITVDDNTEIVMRNLMALEECQRCLSSHEMRVISYYMCFMEDLIDSQKDVSLLEKHGVIQNLLGSDELVAHLFNDICGGIEAGRSKKLEMVVREVNQHYNTRCNQWIHQFCNQHCSNPWKVLSLVAAVLILVMTAVQTVYSVKNK